MELDLYRKPREIVSLKLVYIVKNVENRMFLSGHNRRVQNFKPHGRKVGIHYVRKQFKKQSNKQNK